MSSDNLLFAGMGLFHRKIAHAIAPLTTAALVVSIRCELTTFSESSIMAVDLPPALINGN
jgi:hypothetical protein